MNAGIAVLLYVRMAMVIGANERDSSGFDDSATSIWMWRDQNMSIVIVVSPIMGLLVNSVAWPTRYRANVVIYGSTCC